MLKKADLIDTFNKSIKEYQSKFILIQKDFSDFIGEDFTREYLERKNIFDNGTNHLICSKLFIHDFIITNDYTVK
jgi:hypothetical protein